MNNNQQARSTRIQLLAQADLVLLLADLLRPPAGPQAPGPVCEMPDEDIRAALSAAGIGIDGALSQTLGKAVTARQATLHEELLDEFHRLFEGAMLCPANETAYIRRDKGAIIGDLAGFYRALGLTFDGATGEKPDHILTELEFVAAALTMAAESETGEQREVLLAALSRFAESHLGDWIAGFCHHLATVTMLPCFTATADALLMYANELAAAHGWSLLAAENTQLPLPDPAPADECASFECGGMPQLTPLR